MLVILRGAAVLAHGSSRTHPWLIELREKQLAPSTTLMSGRAVDTACVAVDCASLDAESLSALR